MVDKGMLQSLDIGFGNKVVNALATLFTEKGQKYTLAHETDKDYPEEAESLLQENRENGGYETEIVDTDRLGCQVASGGIIMSFSTSMNSVTYQHFSPNNVRCFFHETVDDDGHVRSVDRSSIEDASYVIIRLGLVDISKWNYLAIFGRSGIYPKGRWVEYTAGNTTVVPEIGDEDITSEFEIDGEICNPLSKYIAENPDNSENVPEYPIAIIYGGFTDTGEAFPTTTSLYYQCLEISCAASHTLSTSQEAAAGTKVISRDHTAMGKPLPRTLAGKISLWAGMKFEYHAHNSQASKDAYDVLKFIQVDIAGSYTVPDYMVISDDHTLEAASGIALKVKSAPLKRFREYREKKNRESVTKIFQCEKVLIKMFYQGDDTAVEQLMGCSQTWTAGEMILPENKKEAAERVVLLMEKGLHDMISALREVHSLPSDEDAIELYETLKTRQGEYPPLAQNKNKMVGLLRDAQGTGTPQGRPGNEQ